MSSAHQQLLVPCASTPAVAISFESSPIKIRSLKGGSSQCSFSFCALRQAELRLWFNVSHEHLEIMPTDLLSKCTKFHRKEKLG